MSTFVKSIEPANYQATCEDICRDSNDVLWVPYIYGSWDQDNFQVTPIVRLCLKHVWCWFRLGESAIRSHKVTQRSHWHVGHNNLNLMSKCDIKGKQLLFLIHLSDIYGDHAASKRTVIPKMTRGMMVITVRIFWMFNITFHGTGTISSQ